MQLHSPSCPDPLHTSSPNDHECGCTAEFVRHMTAACPHAFFPASDSLREDEMNSRGRLEVACGSMTPALRRAASPDGAGILGLRNGVGSHDCAQLLETEGRPDARETTTLEVAEAGVLLAAAFPNSLNFLKPLPACCALLFTPRLLSSSSDENSEEVHPGRRKEGGDCGRSEQFLLLLRPRAHPRVASFCRSL